MRRTNDYGPNWRDEPGFSIRDNIVWLISLAIVMAVAVFAALHKPAHVTRVRQPQSGDHWQGCDAARAAGVTPIYEGEPGYREDMDGDGDGIACEPKRDA